nr:helix-turn-helix domain-containing protein [Kineosporia babensis]
MAVARATFAAEGVDVPIREIARRAEVSAATVYRHFATKQALLAEAFAGRAATCAAIVARGVADDDAWAGFCQVIEQMMALHALERGFARSYTSALNAPAELAAERDRTRRALLGLLRRAKQQGSLREEVEIEDISLALMANDGIRADTPKARAAASRRFAAFMLQSFHAGQARIPLPPAVRLPATG